MALSSSSSLLPSYPPVVLQHCSNVPVLFELLRGEEEQCRVRLRHEMKQIPDPLIDSLFHGLIMSSSSSFSVPQSRWNVSELCELLEGEKVEMGRLLKDEMDRLVNTLFERLTNKLRTSTDLDLSEDGGDRAQLVDTLDRVESANAISHQPSSLIAQPSTSSLNPVAHQQHSNGDEKELITVEMVQIKEEVEDGEETRIIDIADLAEDNQSGDDGSRSVNNEPMDWVKQEIKEEFVDGQIMDIKEEEEEEEDGGVDESRIYDIDDIIDDSNRSADNAYDLSLINESEQQIGTVRNVTEQNNETGQSVQPVTELDQHQSIINNASTSGLRSLKRKQISREMFGDGEVKSDKRNSLTESTSKAAKRIKPGKDDEIQQQGGDVAGDKNQIVAIELNCTEAGCKSILNSHELWKQHLSTSHGLVPYKQLVDNVRTNQHGQTEYPCTECDSVCKSQHSLIQHWRNFHQTGKFECSICAFEANFRGEVKNHQQQTHPTRKFQCTFEGCNKAFKYKFDLEQHGRVHSGERPFACTWDNCEFTCNQLQSATQHVRFQHFHLPRTVKERKELNIIDERNPRDYVQFNR